MNKELLVKASTEILKEIDNAIWHMYINLNISSDDARFLESILNPIKQELSKREQEGQDKMKQEKEESDKDTITIFDDSSKNMEDVTRPDFIIEHGLVPYFNKLTVYLCLWTMKGCKKEDIKDMETHFKWLVELIMSGVLENCDDPQHEIDLAEVCMVILTNFINLWRGKLEMGTSSLIKKWTKKYDDFVHKIENNRQSEKNKEDTKIRGGVNIAS